MIEDWGMVRQWTAEEIAAVQATALADWDAGKVGKEFSEKQLERGISDSVIDRVLRSKSTLIARFYHSGQPRYGFWHPQSQVVVIWRPAEEGFFSELKSCFPHQAGDEYFQRHLWFQPVRWR
jgi:hypothetical protein